MNGMTLVVGMLALLIGGNAVAQTPKPYPNQPVHVVIPFPPGGPTDILARLVGQRLSEDWQQPFVMDNLPGANTAIGAARVAKMPADGYSLLVVMDVTMVLNPLTNPKLSYDPLKDFALITLLAKNISLLSVRADTGPKTLQELIARGKAAPGQLNFGAGIITTRLAAELFNREAGFTAQYVPFQGSPPTVQGLMTGSVDYIVDGAATSLPLIQAGQLRALAKSNAGAVPSLPYLKSLAAEVGAPALDDISTWIGLVAPAGTPPAIVDKLNRAVQAMFADDEFVARLRKAGIYPARSTPEEFRTFITSETARWGKVVKEIDIQLN